MSQFKDRYTVIEAIDEVLDSLRESGPAVTEHRSAVQALARKNSDLVGDLLVLQGMYADNELEVSEQATEMFADTVRDVKVVKDAMSVGMERLATGMLQGRVALRAAGDLPWEDKTPDAPDSMSEIV